MFTKLQTIARSLGLRGTIFLALTLLAYSLFFYFLFIQGALFPSGIALVITYILLNFLAIDLRKVKLSWIAIPLLGYVICFLLFTPPGERKLLLAMLFSLSTLFLVLYFQRNYFKKVRQISWLDYFSASTHIFALLTTFTYSFAILGLNSKFPFTCEQILGINGKIIERSLAPLEEGKSFGKVLWWGVVDLVQKKEATTLPESELILVVESEVPTEASESFLGKIKSDFTTRTNSLVHEVQTTQREIKMNACNAIVSKMKTVYENSVFQLVVVFLMYLLFFGIIRLLLSFISYLGYGIFFVLKFFWAYPTQKVLKEVEEVI